MRKITVILLLVIMTGYLYSASQFEKTVKDIENRKDLFWGFGEADNSAEASDISKMELAGAISKWYLEDIGIDKLISYGNRDKYVRMVKVWLESMSADIKSESANDKDYQEICYISLEKIKQYYIDKENEIKEEIIRGKQALELNKLGIFYRCFYTALIEIDLLAGKKLNLEDEVWDSERLIKDIGDSSEKLAIKIISNTYELGVRRVIFQVLYEKRPVNDVRIGVLMGDEYKYYSVSDRYFQVDFIGYEYEAMTTLNFKIDIQDSECHIWGDEVRKLSNITGMDGYEVYRTVPLRKVEYTESNWKDVRLPVEEGELVLDAGLRNLLFSIEGDSVYNAEIFSSDEVKDNFLLLQRKMKLANMAVDPGIKRLKYKDGSMWRGFDVQIQFAGVIWAMSNLVVTTDAQDKINGVWLGIKPLDYRLLSRKYKEDKDINEFLETVELIEKQYTDAVCGKSLNIKGYPYTPENGWTWVEIENIDLDVMENGAVYSYDIVIAGSERSWEFEFNGIKE